MPKIIKPGKVCIILAGRHAGKKAVILAGKEEGSKARNYPHAIVAGVDRPPRKVTRRMGAKKVAKRSKVKPFVQVRRDCFDGRAPGSLESCWGWWWTA